MSSIKVHKDNFFVTSDIHFFHNNIIKYCNRPWADIDKMTEGIIKNWNEVVTRESDSVFIIGDLAMGGKNRGPELSSVLRHLNGQKYLIPGNHDTYVLKDLDCLQQINILDRLQEVTVIGDGGEKQKFVMCHYAMKIWNLSHQGSIHLYGHSHGMMPKDYSTKSMDVGLDTKDANYRPYSYEQIMNLMSIHRQEPVDHHDSSTR